MLVIIIVIVKGSGCDFEKQRLLETKVQWHVKQSTQVILDTSSSS